MRFLTHFCADFADESREESFARGHFTIKKLICQFNTTSIILIRRNRVDQISLKDRDCSRLRLQLIYSKIRNSSMAVLVEKKVCFATDATALRSRRLFFFSHDALNSGEKISSL